MNKELVKRIILFFGVVVLGVILLLPAINNFKTKENYEKQRQYENGLKYQKYFGSENDK